MTKTIMRRKFHWLSKAWYGKANMRNRLDSITFGHYHHDENGYSEGTSGEMSMEWVDLGGKATAKLECFHDAMIQLVLFKDVFEEIVARHKNKNFSPKEFAEILESCGFIDSTERKQKD